MMKHRSRAPRSAICVLAAVAALCCGAATPAQESGGRPAGVQDVPVAAAESNSVASARLMAIRQKIRDLRVEATNRRKEQQQRLRELAAEKRLVERGLEQLREMSSERQSKFERLRLELQDKTVYRKALVERGAEIRSTLAAFLGRVEERIQRGIPWRVASRRSAVTHVQETVRAKGTALSAAVAAASRIQSEQEALGRSVETGPVEIDLAGQRRSVHAFHLGLLAVVYASDDGSVVGFAQAGQTLEEAIADPVESAEAARDYLVAVDILRRRRTPSVVDLRVPVLPMAREAPPASRARPAATEEEGER